MATNFVDKFISKKWKGVKFIHVKGPNTMALPIWMADELWEDEEQVLKEAELDQARINELPKKKRRKMLESASADTKAQKRAAEDVTDDKAERKRRIKTLVPDEGMSQEMKERRERLREQKREMTQKAEAS